MRGNDSSLVQLLLGLNMEMGNLLVFVQVSDNSPTVGQGLCLSEVTYVRGGLAGS